MNAMVPGQHSPVKVSSIKDSRGERQRLTSVDNIAQSRTAVGEKCDIGWKLRKQRNGRTRQRQIQRQRKRREEGREGRNRKGGSRIGGGREEAN